MMSMSYLSTGVGLVPGDRVVKWNNMTSRPFWSLVVMSLRLRLTIQEVTPPRSLPVLNFRHKVRIVGTHSAPKLVGKRLIERPHFGNPPHLMIVVGLWLSRLDVWATPFLGIVVWM